MRVVVGLVLLCFLGAVVGSPDNSVVLTDDVGTITFQGVLRERLVWLIKGVPNSRVGFSINSIECRRCVVRFYDGGEWDDQYYEVNPKNNYYNKNPFNKARDLASTKKDLMITVTAGSNDYNSPMEVGLSITYYKEVEDIDCSKPVIINAAEKNGTVVRAFISKDSQTCEWVFTATNSHKIKVADLPGKSNIQYMKGFDGSSAKAAVLSATQQYPSDIDKKQTFTASTNVITFTGSIAPNPYYENYQSVAPFIQSTLFVLNFNYSSSECPESGCVVSRLLSMSSMQISSSSYNWIDLSPFAILRFYDDIHLSKVDYYVNNSSTIAYYPISQLKTRFLDTIQTFAMFQPKCSLVGYTYLGSETKFELGIAC